MLMVIIGLPLLVAIYALIVVMRALALKITPRPYSIEWSNDYLLRAARIKQALGGAIVILVMNAFIFLPPLFLSIGDRHVAALFGVVDLACLIVVYALWRWVEKLIRIVRQHTEYRS